MALPRLKKDDVPTNEQLVELRELGFKGDSSLMTKGDVFTHITQIKEIQHNAKQRSRRMHQDALAKSTRVKGYVIVKKCQQDALQKA